MSGFFRSDSSIIRFLSTVFDLALLNIATLLLCIPVVTAGAAVTALYGVLLDYLNKTDESLSVRRLLREWIFSLRRATAPWLGILALLFLLAADMRIVGYMPEEVRAVFSGGVILTAAIVLLTAAFFFPLLSQNPQRRVGLLLRQSVVRAVGLLPRTASVLALWLVPGALLVFLPRVFIALTAFWLAGWFSLCGLAGGKLLSAYLTIAADRP